MTDIPEDGDMVDEEFLKEAFGLDPNSNRPQRVDDDLLPEGISAVMVPAEQSQKAVALIHGLITGIGDHALEELFDPEHNCLSIDEAIEDGMLEALPPPPLDLFEIATFLALEHSAELAFGALRAQLEYHNMLPTTPENTE